MAGTAVTIVSVLLLGFAAHLGLVSHLMHSRAQETGYDELRATLARATTPVGQLDFRGDLVEPGTPMALLEIPALGLSEVVREGTSSEVLTMGPGHRRDTVLPGQPGASVLMGRNFAYGGPFAEIDRLVAGTGHPGDDGPGQHRYEVVKVRRAGSLQLAPLGANEGRLTLVSADGPWFMPSGVIRVDAELVSEPQPRPTRVIPSNALPEAEQVMNNDRTALIPLVFWAQALFLAAAAMVLALAKWGQVAGLDRRSSAARRSRGHHRPHDHPTPPQPVLSHMEDPHVSAVDAYTPPPPPTDTSALPVVAVQPVPLASIEARNISAWFGERKVLDRVSLTMQPGQVTALIGPSGCGKSTFLRILNRMHELVPSASLAGEVWLDGVDIYERNQRLTDARRHIGMVFQKPNPFPAMSIYDNVLAGLRLTGIRANRDTKDALVEECLIKAGLWVEVRDRLRQPGGALSGGQQQRLCIARSLAVRPRVLLMDEPCSALDPTSTRRIEETIGELVSEVTIVIVTHNMQQAARVSQQCAFFLATHDTPGHIVETGGTRAAVHRSAATRGPPTTCTAASADPARVG